MPKSSAQQIRLTRTELYAAWLACSNYTPGRKQKWKQKAQAKAAQKFREGLAAANGMDNVPYTK
jgi:hypothetical protein